MPQANLEKIKVMIIEDQKEMRRIITVMLQSIGVKKITEADNGVAAFRLLQHMKELPHIVFLDLHMKEMDGLTFAQKIRLSKSELLQKMRLIVLTGDSEILLKTVSEQLGAVDVLLKPISAPMLGNAIIQAIKGPQIPAP